MQLVAEIHRNPKERREPFKFSEFFLWRRKPKPRGITDPTQMWQSLRALFPIAKE